MGQQTRNTLKGWFKIGKKPLAAQFADWIDSYWHKSDSIPISSITDLQTSLNNCASTTQLNALAAVVTALSEQLNNGLIGEDGVNGTIKIYKATAPDVGVCIAIFADGEYQEIFNNLYIAP